MKETAIKMEASRQNSQPGYSTFYHPISSSPSHGNTKTQRIIGFMHAQLTYPVFPPLGPTMVSSTLHLILPIHPCVPGQLDCEFPPNSSARTPQARRSSCARKTPSGITNLFNTRHLALKPQHKASKHSRAFTWITRARIAIPHFILIPTN